MKYSAKFLITAALFCSTLPVFKAQTSERFVTLHCDSPGELVLSEEARIAPYLKVTGDINAVDFVKLKPVTINVTRVLDLSETVIHEYTGTDGTQLDLSPNWIWSPPPAVTYPANTLPTQAFTEVRDNSLSKYIRGSYSLQKLILPATLTGFMEDALTNNYVLTEIEAPSSSTTIRSEDHLIYSYDGTTLLAMSPAYYGDLTVAETVTDIASHVFSGMKPASITFKSPQIPTFGEKNEIDAAYIIAEDAEKYKELFPDIDCITSVQIINVENCEPGQLLLSIGNQGYSRSEVRALEVSGNLSYADFLQVTQLPNLHIADLSECMVTMETGESYTFSNPAVTRFEFPVFDNYLSLQISDSSRLYGHLNVPEGTSWFASSSPRFTSVIFPTSLTNVDTWLFREFSVIESIDFSRCHLLTQLNGPLYFAGRLSEVKLPEGLIKLSGFGGPVKQINLPNSLESLTSPGGWILEKLVLPPSLINFEIESLPCVTEIDVSQATGLSSFAGLSHSPCLKELDLSSAPIIRASLFSADMLFSNSTSSSKKPQRLVGVGGTGYKARKVAAIESLILPSTLQSFNGVYCCNNLKTLDLMSCFRLQKIEGLESCPSLESLSLPESLTSITGLYECESLKTINIAATTPPSYSSNNEKLDFSKITLNICYGATGAYRMAEGWENCAQINEIGYRVSIVTDKLDDVISDPSRLLLYGAGIYEPGKEVKISAVPSGCYKPEGWIVNDSQTDNNPYIFKIEDNITAYPVYTVDNNSCDIVMTINIPVNQTFNIQVISDNDYMLFLDNSQYAEYKSKNDLWAKKTYSINLDPGDHVLSINGKNISLEFIDPYEELNREDIYSITSFITNNKNTLRGLYPKFFDIERLDLSGSSQLNYISDLGYSNNIIKSLDISSCPELDYVQLDNCELENLICNNSGLTDISVCCNKLRTLNLSGMSALIGIYAYNNLLTEFYMDAPACEYLNLHNNPMAFSTLTPQMYDIYMAQREEEKTDNYIIDFLITETEFNTTGSIDLSAQMFPPDCDTPTTVTINGNVVKSVEDNGVFAVPYGDSEIILSNEAYPNLLYRARIKSDYEYPIDKFILNHSNVTLQVGESIQLEALIFPETTPIPDLYWHSYDENVATVDNGYVEAIGAGTTNILLHLTGYNLNAFCEVTVLDDAAVDNVTDDKNYVRVVNNTIIVDSPDEIAIYTSDGQLIYTGFEGRVENLSTGIYIVVANGSQNSQIPVSRKLHIK